eukprot:CAMPEP_0203761478 /NCGR_PEP_ID=MMETSP0098-20131031/14562_1 /ASSEMBLY_ACC=CAM_ASM_000208 /TAXON_ID=96639 /ORGANISM=" , Strain NY0313808BC1" /LENGTH=579 /DNA_ID=CAMNT_0050655495 /DNA_START=94 /DNA_END=1830 /DNA_ORIENTATION=+
MESGRNALKAKVEAFYKKHDASRLGEGIDAIVDYGLAEGVDVLNAVLLEKYGACLDGGGANAFDDKLYIRSRIEMFYLKNEPSKLDNKDDMNGIVEWVMYNGIDSLNDKLFLKYGEVVEEVQESDVYIHLEAFYAKHNPKKSPAEIRAVLDWGVVNGFTDLNLKMIERYGEGLGMTDRKKLRKDTTAKLTSFYTQHNPEKLDPDNLEFIVEYALKHGMNNLNTRLQAKYSSNLTTIQRDEKRPLSKNIAQKARQSIRKSLSVFSTGADRSVRIESIRDAQAAVLGDLEYQEYLRKLIEIFYAREDPNKLLDGVSAIMEYALAAGESALNKRLVEKYGRNLDSIDKEFQAMRKKITNFYKTYDPTKLEPERVEDLDTIVGWALVHGKEKLNAALMKKYDEDVDGSGLSKRLQHFYKTEHGTEKKQEELEKIVAWTFSNGVDKLNKKLHKKYGKSLVDTTFNHMSESQEHAAPSPVEIEEPCEIPEEGERNTTQEKLENKLKMFYEKKAPEMNNNKHISQAVDQILETGVEAFNAQLVDTFGESLVSMERARSSTRVSRAEVLINARRSRAVTKSMKLSES